MKPTVHPSYLIAPGDPVIEKYRPAFEPFNDYDQHTFSINVHRSMIEQQDVLIVHQVALALQHYPELIHKLLFCVDFTFSQLENSSLHIAKRIWRQDPMYCHWFRRLSDLPFILFFIQDEDARYYTLIGDMLAEGEVQTTELYDLSIPRFFLTKDQTEILEERLFRSCVSFLGYCQGSGFNPIIFVQGLLAFFDASFTYEDVLYRHKKDLEKDSSNFIGIFPKYYRLIFLSRAGDTVFTGRCVAHLYKISCLVLK